MTTLQLSINLVTRKFRTLRSFLVIIFVNQSPVACFCGQNRHRSNWCIKNLNLNKTCGPNSCLTNLLKVGEHLLSTPISFIINKSFETGVLPSSLKLACLVPLLQCGAQDKCGNYRSILPLSNLSKVFERAIYNLLYSYLETMKIISPLQFGFLKMHFTNHALVSVIKHVKIIIDHGNFACGLFRPFDTVNINILLETIINYDIRGPDINWFKSYLYKDAVNFSQLTLKHQVVSH